MAQIGTVRLETQNSGAVDVPVFEPGDSASGIYEFVRVETASGPGFIPVTDPVDATYPYLRVQSQNNGIVAVTDTPGSDIPDSVASRPDDDSDLNISVDHGLFFETKDEWPSIGARISNNTSGVTTAYLYDWDESENTRSLITDIDISGLSSGDSFTFEGVNLTSGEEYLITVDAGGSDFTDGFASGESAYPYTSDFVDITSVWNGSRDDDGGVSAVNDIGNTGFE